MIYLDDLAKIVELALCSAYIEGEKPLSLLVISDRPESGKTEAVKRYSKVPFVKFATDISGYGIKRDFAQGILDGTIRHIVVPELLQPLMKGKVSAQSFVTTLQAMMEDGVMGIHTGFLPQLKMDKEKDIKAVGVIGCLPRPLLTRQLRYEWAKTGFWSRWLVVTYCYNEDAIDKIMGSIERGEYLQGGKSELVFDGVTIPIKIPPDVARAIRQLAEEVIGEARKAGLAYGYREQKHIRRLVAANVIHDRIKNGATRASATMEDFNEIERLGYLFNEQYNAVKQ